MDRQSDFESESVKLPAIRHDAFTGEQMARFCEALAETGTVTAAAKAAGKNRDTVYQHRRRNPLFAAAWAGALSHARSRLADQLLERAIEGSVDYIYRDGALVGERHHMDNRLAYAMLRRLDKQAEEQPARAAAEHTSRDFASATMRADYEVALKALRTGSKDDLGAALAVSEGLISAPDKPDNPLLGSDATVGLPDEPFDTDRVWNDEGIWRTNFPPPSNYEGRERGRWDAEDYTRECTNDETNLLEALLELRTDEQRKAEEAERDDFFAQLRILVDAEQCQGEPGSAGP